MVGPDGLALYFDDFFLAEAFPPFRPAAFFCAVVPEASGIALVGTSCADERSTFKGIGPSPLPGFGYQGPIRTQNPLRLRSEARPATLDSIRERAPQRQKGCLLYPRGFSSLATSAGVPSRLATTTKRSFS